MVLSPLFALTLSVAVAAGESAPESNPSPRVVLLVPADLPGRFDARIFSEAVQLYATGSDLASVIISNLPESILLTTDQARTVGRTLGGQIVVWPTVEGADLHLHVLPVGDARAIPEIVTLILPEHADRPFYRLAALKLQSVLRSLPTRATPVAEPVVVVDPAPPPTATIREPEPAPRRVWIGAEAAGAAFGPGTWFAGGAALSGGLGWLPLEVGLVLSFLASNAAKNAEGAGGALVGGAALRLRALVVGDAAAWGVWAEIDAGAQWLHVSGHLADGQEARRLDAVVPWVGPAVRLSHPVGGAGRVAVRVGADLYPERLRVLLATTPAFDSGHVAAVVTLGYQHGL